MNRRTRRSLPAVLACASLLAAGCAGPVALPDPQPAPAERAICDQILTDLPQTVLDQKRRETSPGGLTAAWGNPPITLTCGIPKPAGIGPDSSCFEVNGVGWYAEEGEGGWLFTTLGRAAYVQLGVPSEYAPEANALVDVADAVSRHDTLLQPCL